MIMEETPATNTVAVRSMPRKTILPVPAWYMRTFSGAAIASQLYTVVHWKINATHTFLSSRFPGLGRRIFNCWFGYDGFGRLSRRNIGFCSRLFGRRYFGRNWFSRRRRWFLGRRVVA